MNKEKPTPLTRRELFKSLTTSKNVAEKKTVQRTTPRPPNAVDEDIFERVCKQCGACESACPESIIYLQDGYPRLDIEYSHCTLCGECARVCPSIALSSEKQDTGLRAIITNNCINRHSYCDSCKTSCPSGALIWQNDQIPQIDADKCSGCAQCKSDCFINAIQLTLSNQS